MNTRCPKPCGKRRYDTETVAQLACIQAAMRGKPNRVWYRAGDCRCWHITHRRASGRGGRRGQWVHGFTTGAAP